MVGVYIDIDRANSKQKEKMDNNLSGNFIHTPNFLKSIQITVMGGGYLYLPTLATYLPKYL
jgi:hypothetical protein